MDRVSRRDILSATAAAGGGLLLGFALPGCGQPGVERTTALPFAPNAFVRIDRQGQVTLIMHKVEMGQGTYTSMPMLLAEELEVGLDQVRLEHAPPSDKRLGYGALVDTAATLPVPRHVPLKDPKDFTLIGTAAKRLDAPDKVTGAAV